MIVNINAARSIIRINNIKITMNVHNQKILDFVNEKTVATSSEIAKLLKLSWNTAERYLTELLIEGKLNRIKKEGVTLWMKR